MKIYSTYNDSGILWIPKKPENWAVCRSKALFQSQKETNLNNKETNVLSLTLKGVIRNNKNKPIGLSPSDYSTYQIFEKGDLVFKLIDLNNIATSRVGLVPERGIMSSAYIRLIPRSADLRTRYFYMQYYSLWLRNIFNNLGAGVRQTINANELLNMKIVVPSPSEQDQIVRFLDWKVSSINKLINIRKNEINKLEELKRSKILNCVMGQEDDVRSKLSSISWVKNIPYNWSEETLIQVAEEQKIKNVGLAETNLLSLSYGKIIEKDINTTEGLLPFSFEGYQIVYPGNIILRLTDLQNDRKSLRTGISTTKGIITSAYTCLKVRGNIILPEYLHLQLHSADLCKVFYGMGGGVRQSIGFKEIRNLIIAIPPIEEQRRILDVAKQIDNQSNLLIEKYREQISALNDLKQRLISDVVTGQIDVRNIEIPEYEYVDEEPESDSDVDRDFDNEEISEEA